MSSCNFPLSIFKYLFFTISIIPSLISNLFDYKFRILRGDISDVENCSAVLNDLVAFVISRGLVMYWKIFLSLEILEKSYWVIIFMVFSFWFFWLILLMNLSVGIESILSWLFSFNYDCKKKWGSYLSRF